MYHAINSNLLEVINEFKIYQQTLINYWRMPLKNYVMHSGEPRFQYFCIVAYFYLNVRSQLQNKFNSHRKQKQTWGLLSSGVVTQRDLVFVYRRFRRAYLVFKGQAVQVKFQERIEAWLYRGKRWWLVLRASLKYHNFTFISRFIC
jgi:hypothetical protein